MKNLHIIMPMAGEGKRFKDLCYDIPKPLIKVNNKELYRRAIDSIELYNTYKEINIKHTFIVRKEFIDNYEIDKQIKEYYPNSNIISIEKTTRGALETVLLAESYIDPQNDNILILDCDIEFICIKYIDEIFHRCKSYVISPPLLLSFYSRDARYSYAQCDVYEDNDKYYASKVREKDPMSSHALIGSYFFGNAEIFLKLAKEYFEDFINKKINSKEVYVSLLYNYYFNNGFKYIRLFDLNQHFDKFISYGTPEEYEFAINNKYNNIWDKK